jgi:hypothetical protein
VALLLALLAVAIGRRMFYQRPPTVTNLMLALQLWLLIGVAEGWIRKQALAALPPMIALWTNLHGGWMAGGVVLAAFSAEWTLTQFRQRLPLPLAIAPVAPGFRTMAVLLPLCLAATLANPYGIELYKLPGRVLAETALVRSLSELRPPDFYFTIDFEFFVLGTIVLSMFVTRSRPRLAELLLWLFFAHQAIQHVRHLSLFSIVMVPMSARLLSAALDEARAAIDRRWSGFPGILGIPSTVTLGAALLFSWWLLLNPRETGTLTRPLSANTYPERFLRFVGGEAYTTSAFPVRVCNIIELAGLEGRMFNENYYAGYLIWRLAPEPHKVFSDPRFDIFGGRIWREEAAISAGAFLDPRGARLTVPYYQALLDKWDIQWIITNGDTGLGRRLYYGVDGRTWALGAHWQDHGSLLPESGWQIWVRDTPANQDMLRRVRELAPMEDALPGR